VVAALTTFEVEPVILLRRSPMRRRRPRQMPIPFECESSLKDRSHEPMAA